LNQGSTWNRIAKKPLLSATLTGALLGAMGAKVDNEAFMEQVGGYVCAVENWLEKGDAVVTLTVLLMACLQLLDTKKFIPKPAELMKACRQAAEQRSNAYASLRATEYYIRRCDAVLMLFAPEKWTEPYEVDDYRETLECMLEAHEEIAPYSSELKELNVEGTFSRTLAIAREVHGMPQKALPGAKTQRLQA
jgi:hypothetical protein